MCRNIRTLHNYSPAATADEVHAAALQYVRKVSGTAKPSAVNQPAFDEAVTAVAHATQHLLERMVTTAPPKDREVEAAKARERNAIRYGAGATVSPDNGAMRVKRARTGSADSDRIVRIGDPVAP
jgi:hypothetical protein